jgi:hypothetical protein
MEEGLMPYPDYQGHSLVNLMASLHTRFADQEGRYKPLICPDLELAAFDQIVLLVLDGFGYHYLREHAGWMQPHCLRAIDAVFPSTTAASITTFLTGQAPQQHGLTGWFTYLSELKQVTTVLPCMPRGSRTLLSADGVDIAKLYGHPIFFDQFRTESHVVSPSWILQTDFNRAHTGRAHTVGYESLSEMCDAIVNLLTSGSRQKYIYAYWPEFDHLSHVHGNQSPEVAAHYEVLLQQIDRLLKQAKGRRSLVLITADHGFIDTTPDKRICVNDHPQLHSCLRLPLCGEPRAAYCYVQPGKEEEFIDIINNQFSHAMELVNSTDLIDKGVFGPGEPHHDLHHRVGDYTLIMKENYTIKDWLPSEQPFFHYGVHGGTSDQEIKVPLIALPV